MKRTVNAKSDSEISHFVRNDALVEATASPVKVRHSRMLLAGIQATL